MILSSEERKKIEDFTKYARFVGEKFGVDIVFDGVNAHTDGNTITLPNITAMTEEELDFLYGILLHEVGHVRYSSFTKEDFQLLKTEVHSYIANGIEDARIENLLIDEFGGARDIFEKLYNEHCLNKDLMKKIFGINNKDMNMFFAVTIYLHNYILKLSKKPGLKDLFTEDTEKELVSFVEKNNLNAMVDKNALKNWNDVVQLANEVYDLLIESYKDNSGDNKLLKQDSEIKYQIKKSEDILQESTSQKKRMTELQQQIKDLKFKIREEMAQREPEFKILNDELYNKEKRQEEIGDVLTQLYKKERFEDKISELNNKIKTSKEKILKHQEKLVGASDKKLEDFTKKIEKLNEKINKYNDQNKNLNESLEEILKENPLLNTFNKESLEKDHELLSESVKKLNLKIKEYKGFKSEDLPLLEKLNKEYKEINQKMNNDIIQYLKEMFDSISNQGISIDTPMIFDPLKDWDEGNDFQKKWDEKVAESLNTLVANGVGMNTSGRDMILEIEKSKNKLESINLAEIFKKENNLSKFESMDEVSQINNVNIIDSKNNDKIYRKRLVPVTKMYDIIKNETFANSTKKITTFKKENSDFLKRIKSLFKKKLAFSKKDHFKGGKEEGDLDPRNMWKLASKIDTDFFEINRPKFKNKVTVSIAMDISGSMDQEYTKQGENLRNLSLLISEGLFECHINHEIVGYHAPLNMQMKTMNSSSIYGRKSNNLETIVYKKYGDKSNKGLENVEIQCTDNSDGESLKFIAEKLLKQTAKKRILFIITDGKPYLSGEDEKLLDQDLINTIHWIKSQKIKLFVFGFNDDPKRYYGEDYFKLDKLEDFEEFLKKMG